MNIENLFQRYRFLSEGYFSWNVVYKCAITHICTEDDNETCKNEPDTNSVYILSNVVRMGSRGY